jgi:hypothetical protein
MSGKEGDGRPTGLAQRRGSCPLSTVASRLTDELSRNFDIYLPLWLARYNRYILGIFWSQATLTSSHAGSHKRCASLRLFLPVTSRRFLLGLSTVNKNEARPVTVLLSAVSIVSLLPRNPQFGTALSSPYARAIACMEPGLMGCENLELSLFVAGIAQGVAVHCEYLYCRQRNG